MNKAWSGTTVYNTMTDLIKQKAFADAEAAMEKLNAYYALDVLNTQQYMELVALVKEVYGE